MFYRSGFGPTYTKIGTIQRRLAWPLRKDDTQNREAFQTFTFIIITQVWIMIALWQKNADG